MNDAISLGQAFAYCATLTSYWIWIGVVVIFLFGGLGVLEWFGRKNNVDASNAKMVWAIAFILLLAIAIGKDPFNVSQNTTKADAKRGVFIGL